MLRLKIFAIIVIVLTLAACRKDKDQVADPEISGWNENTHGNSGSPDYSVVFPQDEVLRFDIQISSEDWETMQSDLADNLSGNGGPGMMPDFDPVWVPCSVFFNGIEWYRVGIRYKGNSSLRSSYQKGIKKLSFKLDFDQFEDAWPELTDQRFYGFKQLNLKNNFEDLSMMREKVGSDLFRWFGLASPEVAFCEVYVDVGSGPQYFGLYSLVEEVDDSVLETQFGYDSGTLYKPDGQAASFSSGSFNESEMEKKNNEEAADFSDVLKLYNAINSNTGTTDPEQWKKDLEAIFNVDIFLKWLAANTVMQNWDTYGVMTHNYYLYNDPAINQLTWIPWDNNEALQEGKQGGAVSLSLQEVGANWPLIRYLIDDAGYNEKYETYMLQFIQETFIPGDMVALYNSYSTLLQQYAYAEEPGYTFLNNDAQFDQAVQELKTHVEQRNSAVQAFLN